MRRRSGARCCLILAAMLLLPLVATHPVEAAAGTWTRTGDMGVSRVWPDAVLLLDGRVLVIGGLDHHGNPRKSAEIYDPATGTWTRTSDMTTTRSDFSATRLPDGRVLVAGGIGLPPRQPIYASAEIYDPASGTWSPTGSMITPREEFAATLLTDGRVLVEGGWGGREVTNAEIYDPASGTWTATGSMTVGRYWQSATLLADGRVLVAGGFHYTPATAATASAEVYDPASGTWSTTADMLLPRTLPSATRLPDGRVLVADGVAVHDANAARSVEIYDPVAGTWTRTASTAVLHPGFSLTSLADGRVLAAGGSIRNASTAVAEAYDPASGTWSRVANMNRARQGQAATLLTDGRVLVAGGFGDTAPYEMMSAEIYDPSGGA